MQSNPEIVRFEKGYGIRFTRNNWKVLVWVQDLTKRSMKSDLVDRPVVLFDTREAATVELLTVVIPHLLNDKGVELGEIVGWA